MFNYEILYSIFSNSSNNLVNVCHNASVKGGWWNDINTGEAINPTSVVPEKLCLIHSEVSEALEGFRKNLNDTHLPNRLMIEVELADTIIRICDLAGAMGLNIGEALLEKLEYNQSREDHKLENRIKEGGKKL